MIVRALVVATAAVFLASCAATDTPPGPGASTASVPATRSSAARPRLAVLLVIDGLPQWQLTEYRDQLAPDGLRRFLDRGAWFPDAHYGHAHPVTASGHATLLTGAYPHKTGIVGNNWRDPKTGQWVYSYGDTDATYIGHKTDRLDGTSPKNLLAETVGDVLVGMDSRSKVFSVSAKDRGAIPTAGKKGVAYIYMDETGFFASTTYYMKEHPEWWTAFYRHKPQDRYFDQEWKPLFLESAAYAKSLPDNQKWYARGGALPKLMGVGMQKPGPDYYKQILGTPFIDQYTLAFSLALMQAEKLGEDTSPDLLAISLSGHDFVNHAYSAESRLSQDHLLQVDRSLAIFFGELDKLVGKDNYVLVLSSDHGFMPAPENTIAKGGKAGEQSSTAMTNRLNAELGKQFGEGKWVVGHSASGILLDRKVVAEKKANFNDVASAARRIVLTEPGVAAAYTRAELESGRREESPYIEQVRKTWYPDRSADVQYVLKPFWMMSTSSAATHGSPHAYDTNVPVAFYGPRWVKPGRVDTRVEVADIAPTLAGILAVPAPSSSEGKVLPLPQ